MRKLITIFFLGFILISENGFSQCEFTSYPDLCGVPSGAYITQGPPDTDFRNWNTVSLWNKLKGNNKQYPTPPLVTSSNNTYIEIAEGHKVKLDEPFAFGNKLTLVICGELEVGTIIELPPVVTESVSIDCDKNQFLFSGDLPNYPGFEPGTTLLDTLINSTLVYQVGFEIALWNADVTDYIVLPYKIYYNVPKANFNGTFSLIVDIGSIFSSITNCDEFYGSNYNLSVRSFAKFGLASGINRTAYGEMLFFPETSSPGKSTKEGEEYNFVNSLTLIICPTGRLIMDKLEVKNVASLEVNGTFVVNQILGNNQQNNCIFSTSEPPGVIITPEGTTPYINTDGWSFGGGATGNQNCISQGAIVLPVKLLSFTPDIKPDRINITWATGTEINNDYFTIERSRDLYGWEVLGYVEGAGNSSVPLDYSFTDMRPLDGLAYYRLKQTDYDGKYEYFGPIAAHYDLGLDGLEFKVIKNFSNWIIAVPSDGLYQVQVYTLNGRLLTSEKVENTLTIPAPQGAVVIRVTDGFERSTSRVVM